MNEEQEDKEVFGSTRTVKHIVEPLDQPEAFQTATHQPWPICQRHVAQTPSGLTGGEGEQAANQLRDTLANARHHSEQPEEQQQEQQPQEQQPPPEPQQQLPQEGTGEANLEHPLKPWMKRETVPVTYSLLGINCAIFLLMAATTWGASIFSPTAATLIGWGADWGPLTLSGQFWRLLTCAFVHIGIVHIAMNMYCLLDGGTVIERLLGCRKMLAIYLFSALGGSILGLLLNPSILSAGASGAVFGVYGALLVFLQLHKKELPPGTFSRCSRLAVAFVGYNILFGAVRTGVDNAAHIGGLVTGALAAWMLICPIAHAAEWRLRHTLWSLGLFVTLSLAYAGQCLFNYGAPVVRAFSELSAGNNKAALAIVEPEIKKHPTAMAYTVASIAHMQLSQWEAGINDANHVIELSPTSHMGYSLRGAACLMKGDGPAAKPDLERAVRLSPTDLLSARMLVCLYISLDEPDKAKALAESVRTKNPGDAKAANLYATMLMELGNDKDAMLELNRQRGGKGPDSEQGQAMLATIQKNLGNYKQALAIEFALANKKDSADVEKQIAIIKFESGDIKGALSALDKAEKLELNGPREPMYRALFELTSGDYKQGAADATEALKRCKNAPYLAEYNVIYRMLSARGLGDQRKSTEILALEVPATRTLAAPSTGERDLNKVWPHPVVEYLDGTLSGEDLLQLVKNSRPKATEARTYMALAQIIGGQPDKASKNISWVAEHGMRGYTEYSAAKYLQSRSPEPGTDVK